MSEALQNVLVEVISSLADFFGTTSEAIMSQLPTFLAKYGWYSTIRGLWAPCLIALMIGAISFGGAGLADSNHPMIWGISGIVLAFLISAGIMIGSCAIAPEIAGAHAIIEIFQCAGR